MLVGVGLGGSELSPIRWIRRRLAAPGFGEADSLLRLFQHAPGFFIFASGLLPISFQNQNNSEAVSLELQIISNFMQEVSIKKGSGFPAGNVNCLCT